jgi:hypothetical protein
MDDTTLVDDPTTPEPRPARLVPLALIAAALVAASWACSVSLADQLAETADQSPEVVELRNDSVAPALDPLVRVVDPREPLVPDDLPEHSVSPTTDLTADAPSGATVAGPPTGDVANGPGSGNADGDGPAQGNGTAHANGNGNGAAHGHGLAHGNGGGSGHGNGMGKP